MKALFSFALALFSLSALAQGPVLRGPGTTNTPAVWTNLVGVISVNSNALALSQKVGTNETRAVIITNAANVLGGNGAAITGLAGQTNQSNAVTTNDSRALNLSGANIFTNASNTLGGNGAAITSIPPGALTSTPPFTNSVIGYGDARQTNSAYIGPGGFGSSNSAGNVTLSGGTITANNLTGSNYIAGPIGMGGTNYPVKVRVGGAAETTDAVNITGTLRTSGSTVVGATLTAGGANVNGSIYGVGISVNDKVNFGSSVVGDLYIYNSFVGTTTSPTNIYFGAASGVNPHIILTAAPTPSLTMANGTNGPLNVNVSGVFSNTNGPIHGTNTFVGGVAVVPPGSTVVPAGWMPITNAGARYYIPLYQ